MKKIFKIIIYRLGGADYQVIQHCNKTTQWQYLLLALALLQLFTAGFIGGFDAGHQFTKNPIICTIIGVIWALNLFLIDFIIINSSKVTRLNKGVRIVVAAASVLITLTALFVLMNEGTIDTRINNQNTERIIKCDSAYENEKADRYAAYQEQVYTIADYHKSICIPESKKYFAGSEYAKKHAYCIASDTTLAKIKTQLDSSEVNFNKTYLVKRAAIVSENSNDFFRKAIELIPLFKSNKMALFLAICLFLYLGYLETQVIILKSTVIHDNDEYHIHLRQHEAERQGQIAQGIQDQELSNQKIQLLKNAHIKEETEMQQEENDRSKREHFALRELELLKEMELYEKHGMKESQKIAQMQMEDLRISYGLAAYTDNSSDIFHMSQPMIATVEKVKEVSSSKTLIENIFNWVVENISYDDNHSSIHYRTARECWNEKKGLCGELACVYIAMLRYAGVKSTFCEVITDAFDKQVQHACVKIYEKDGFFLSDVAYKTFKVKHKVYKEIPCNELERKYRNWNL